MRREDKRKSKGEASLACSSSQLRSVVCCLLGVVEMRRGAHACMYPVRDGEWAEKQSTQDMNSYEYTQIFKDFGIYFKSSPLYFLCVFFSTTEYSWVGWDAFGCRQGHRASQINWARANKAQKEVEKQNDARANVEAVTLQVLHDKAPSKHWGHIFTDLYLRLIWRSCWMLCFLLHFWFILSVLMSGLRTQ